MQPLWRLPLFLFSSPLKSGCLSSVKSTARPLSKGKPAVSFPFWRFSPHLWPLHQQGPVSCIGLHAGSCLLQATGTQGCWPQRGPANLLSHGGARYITAIPQQCQQFLYKEKKPGHFPLAPKRSPLHSNRASVSKFSPQLCSLSLQVMKSSSKRSSQHLKLLVTFWTWHLAFFLVPLGLSPFAGTLSLSCFNTVFP